ncbi:MAG: hypothetical protein HZB55_18650 [Deltaproteobacteria bacterium]|nr:hypothetical protein [Deltaproteobacteria bacterium]
MTTRLNLPAQSDSTQDPLTSFYEGLGRLATEEGELFEASRAYRRARFFAHVSAVRGERRRTTPTRSLASREPRPDSRNR